MDLNAFNRSGEKYVVPIEDLNENMVRRTITKHDKPHPLLIFGIIVITIIILYIMYVSAIKMSIAGDWYDTQGLIKINHNKWNDTFTIDNKIVGWLVGNALYVKFGGETKMAVVDKKTIHWCGSGEIWRRPAVAKK
jgi:hypothetical protein